MTAASPGQYGASHYETPEGRALATITIESYQKIYDDQGKFLSKLAGDVSYLGASLRKTQGGVDKANENVVQQLQDLVNNFIVILGGGSFADSGIDLGDLKYVLQAIGALFGWQSVGGIPLPINLYDAAWHFFSQYIFPVENFTEVINTIIDGAIATALDIFGEVPIVGQAVEQLAVIISDIRDLLNPVAAAIDALLSSVGLNLNDLGGITTYFGSLQPIWDALNEALSGVSLPDFVPVFHAIALWTEPFITLLVAVVDAIEPLLGDTVTIAVDVIEPVLSWVTPVIQALAPLLDIITDVVTVLNPILDAITTVITALDPIIGAVTEVTNSLQPILDQINNVSISLDPITAPIIDLVSQLAPIVSDIVTVVVALADPVINYVVTIVNELAAIVGGTGNLTSLSDLLLLVTSPLNALNLFNLVPTDLLAQIPISSIGATATNLINDPTFLDSTAFSGGGIWSHAPGQGYLSNGAVSTVANGTTKELLSNLIPVSEGQVIPIAGKAQWTSLAGSGNPVAIGVTGYIPGGSTNQQIIAQHNATPATTTWVDLAGTYTVPANVTSMRVRLIVQATGTAGTVMFSNLSATKTQPLFQKLIQGALPGSTTLADDINSAWSNITSNAANLLHKVEQGDFNSLIASLGGTGSTLSDQLTAIGSQIATYLNNSSPLNASNINTGNIADQFVGGISTINTNIVTKLLNIAGSGFGHSDAASALAQSAFAAIDTSARLAKLETTFTSGVSDGDDFERTSSTSLGSGWLQYYSGGAGIWATPNGHDASFATSGVADRDFLCLRNTGQIRSATDLQQVTKVLGSTATQFALTGVYNYCGHNDIWLRVSDDTTGLGNVTGIRVRFGGDGSVSIVRFVAGIATTLNSLPQGSIVPPGPGSAITGMAGLPGTARVFEAVIGTSFILGITEVGVASGLGAAYRRWGHGGRAEGHTLPLPGQEKPGNCHQWTAKDQAT